MTIGIQIYLEFGVLAATAFVVLVLLATNRAKLMDCIKPGWIQSIVVMCYLFLVAISGIGLFMTYAIAVYHVNELFK